VRVDEPQQRLGVSCALRAEAVHCGIFHVIKNERRAQLGCGDFESHIDLNWPPPNS
jgi:hypothetical protein